MKARWIEKSVVWKPGVLLLLAAMLWHCELNEPSKPPLHRTGIEIFEGQPFESDTLVDYNRAPIATLSRLLDSTFIADNEQRPGYDTLVLIYARIRYEAVQFTRRRDLITPRERCQVDSGAIGNTAPPIKKDCLPIASIVVNIQSIALADTNWLDTLIENVKVPPKGGPLFLPPVANVVNGIWRTSLAFPDSTLPVLTLANPGSEAMIIAEQSWRGTHRFSPNGDSLHLIWPQSSLLGNLSGTLKVKGQTSQLITTLPFEMSRQWVGLIPLGSQIDTYWSLPLGKAAALVPDTEFRRFSMETHAPNQDSLIAIRSRFKLRGDVKASIRLTLPPAADSGCTVAWFFAPPDITPFVEYQGGTRTSAARLNLYTEGIGFYVNTTGRLNPPITLLRTGEALQINQLQGNKSFPKEAVLHAKRQGQSLHLSVCDVASLTTGATGGASACADMATLMPLQGEPQVGPNLQMHLVVGGFGKMGFQVTWQDLTISEGVLVP